MPDDAELSALDPVDLMAQEAARLERHFTVLPATDWDRPSRCDGWTIRDVLAHLAATEAYHEACLEGRVSEFLVEMAERGATDVAKFNAIGIADLDDVPTDDLVRRWSASDAETRRGFRDRAMGEVDTSVGSYPARWQAFHLAGELATHADDVYVAIPPTELAARRVWRARFSRFALAEHPTRPHRRAHRGWYARQWRRDRHRARRRRLRRVGRGSRAGIGGRRRRSDAALDDAVGRLP